jgi:chromosome segregation protein
VRLYKLKLSGFKSFVEPTTVLFPGQLAGVVGPNGCGKSNIIDAVRWVLGESKASELRGESIQDVIFKGSGQSQGSVAAPASSCFSTMRQGRAAGQWSQYAEITVKRVLDREGNSSYYINNLHVRRRDVIDLFLGTGLGPRAYAIIGQGMISRIVEAKPDELRFFLEEAAGVTKYKERRKETEHRLEDARENIARVDDIRNELEKVRSVHLQAQAAVAQQYRGLHVSLSRKQTLLWLKKRNDARVRRPAPDAPGRRSRQSGRGRDRAIARNRGAGRAFAREPLFGVRCAACRAGGNVCRDNTRSAGWNRKSGHLLDSRSATGNAAGPARRRAKPLERRQQATLAEDSKRAGTQLLDNSRAIVSPTAAARHERSCREACPNARMRCKVAGGEVTEARRGLSEAEQALRLAEADKGHALRALENLVQRRTRLEQDRLALGAPDPALLAASKESEQRAEAALAVAQEKLAALQAAIPAAEAQLRAAREALQAAHRSLTETRARHDALAQLQAKVAQSGEIGDWLKARNLADAKPLWQAIQVEAGWETAVEAVLRERFSALVADVDSLRAAVIDPPPAILTLALAGNPTAAPAAADSLRSKVRCDDPRWAGVLDEWLAGVAVADDLATELPLAAGQRVSRAGHVLTPGGLTLYVPDAKTHGVIERQREIDELAGLLAESVPPPRMRRAKYSARRNSTSPTARASSAPRGAPCRKRSRLSTRRRSTPSSWPRRKPVSRSARRRSTATWRNSSARKKPNRPVASVPRTKAGSRASAWPAYASASNRRWTSIARRMSPCARRVPWKSSSGAKRRRPASPNANVCRSSKTTRAPPPRRPASCSASKAKPPPRAPKSPASATVSCGSSCTPRSTPGRARSRRWRNGEMCSSPRPRTCAASTSSASSWSRALFRCATRSTTCGSRRRPPR